MRCFGVVVWFILPIIEPPQSRLFNSGLYWVVAICIIFHISYTPILYTTGRSNLNDKDSMDIS